jgi:hypothetical protein
MWLLILLSIILIILIFMLGSYYAKVESVTKSGSFDRCKERTSCGGNSMGSASCESKASTASGTTEKCESSPASVDMDNAQCKKHGKRHCHVCYKKHDDGFSSNGIIISTPAPF